VAADSPAERAGLKPGDVITRIDGEPISDFLDFYMASFASDYAVTVRRDVCAMTLEISRRPCEDSGAEIAMDALRACNNRCIFCFIDQLPRGLRRELYFKDEDYRLSFLHGNYLTLTNLTRRDEYRILENHLSPLYVSVHATDEAVRSTLLARKRGEGILTKLDRLGAKGIKFHAQIVVVPGHNDGSVLMDTLDELVRRPDFVLSVSVVPVGLTCHRRHLTPLRGVDADLARSVVHLVGEINDRMRSTSGRGVVYVSDELLVLSVSEIPPDTYYDDYPQIENGVGLLRRLLDSARYLRVPQSLQGKSLAFVTGTLAAPYIEKACTNLRKKGVRVEVIRVENELLGNSVTVSGLLAGRDMLSALSGQEGFDAVVLPPNVLNEGGVTLDDMSVMDLASSQGVPVIQGDYDMKTTTRKLDATFGAQ
jgi:putative radical SAM enzyme (TIGR03279 family)